tara:strand:+ start:2452 stop:3300 length:849 start_codon:yes stop_codon:yes gene_type:complete
VRLILTGGTGFLGKYLTESLLKSGAEVLSLIRSKQNINTTHDKQLLVKEYEIGGKDSLPKEISNDFDTIVHLAWNDITDVNSDRHVNEYLPQHLDFLKKIIDRGVKNVFVLGTCYEYGMCNGMINESHETLPITKYGIAKKRLSHELLAFQKKTDFNITWARLFYVYGKGQISSTIYKQLHEAIKNREKIFKMSNGDQLLDYLSVDQVTDILTNLILCKKPNLGFINVCNGSPIRLIDLVENWINESGQSIDLDLGAYPYREFEPKSFWGDRKYLNQILNLK